VELVNWDRFFVHFAALALLVALVSCTPARPTNTDDDGSSDIATEPSVEILTQSGRRIDYFVEVARTDAERARGLMFRNHLDADRGMLFIFPYEAYQSFWMKDTYIPLDMLFIGSDRRLVGVVANAQPLDESSHRVSAPSRYVLEINGGQAEKWGIAAGDEIVFHDIPLNASP